MVKLEDFSFYFSFSLLSLAHFSFISFKPIECQKTDIYYPMDKQDRAGQHGQVDEQYKIVNLNSCVRWSNWSSSCYCPRRFLSVQELCWPRWRGSTSLVVEGMTKKRGLR